MARPRSAPENLVSTNLRIRQDLLDRLDAEAQARDLGRSPILNRVIEYGLAALSPVTPRLVQPTAIGPVSGRGADSPGTGRVLPRLRDVGAAFAEGGPLPPMSGPAGPVRQAAAPPPEDLLVIEPAPREPEPAGPPEEEVADIVAEMVARQEEPHPHDPAEGAPSVCAHCQAGQEHEVHFIHAELMALGFTAAEVYSIIDEALDADISVEAVLIGITEWAKPPEPTPPPAKKRAAKKAAKAASKKTTKKASPKPKS